MTTLVGRDLHRAAPELDAEAAVLAADAAHCGLRGDDPRALAAVEARLDAAAALVDALAPDDAADRTAMLLRLNLAWLSSGRPSVARAGADWALSLAGAGAPETADLLALRGAADAELGRLDAAEDALLSGRGGAWGARVLSEVALVRGDVDGALAHGLLALRRLGAPAAFALADARLAADDVTGALLTLETSGWVPAQLRPLDRAKALDVTVRVLLAARRLKDAAAWSQRSYSETGGRREGVFGAIAAHTRATVLLAEGSPGSAARLALAGAEAGLETPVWAARCHVVAGAALAEARRPAEARAVLRPAAATLAACGANRDREAALRVLRRLSERRHPRAA